MRNRYVRKILCMMTVFCAAALIGCGTKTIQDSDVVMEIAGQSVVKAEYQMILAAHASEIERKYDTDTVNRKDFWTMEQQEGTPLAQVMQLAETDLKYKKTISQLAAEYGIKTKTDYLSIAADMEQENDRRNNGQDSEEVVYGLTSFGIENYYDYIYTQVEYEVMEKLKQEQSVSDQELEEIYKENQEQYTSDVCVKMLVAEMDAGLGMETAEQIAEELKVNSDMESLTEKFPNAGFYEITLSSLNMEEGKSGAYMQRWLTASGMQQGEVCQPFEIGMNLMTMRCLERSDHAVQPFEEIKGTLESSVRTQLAQDDIDEKAGNADVSYEEKVLEQIARETLNVN